MQWECSDLTCNWNQFPALKFDWTRNGLIHKPQVPVSLSWESGKLALISICRVIDFLYTLKVSLLGGRVRRRWGWKGVTEWVEYTCTRFLSLSEHISHSSSTLEFDLTVLMTGGGSTMPSCPVACYKLYWYGASGNGWSMDIGWLVVGRPAHRVNISFRIMLPLIRQQFEPAPAGRQSHCCFNPPNSPFVTTDHHPPRNIRQIY